MTQYNIYKSINDVPKDWDDLVAHDVLLKTAYLKALESAAPSNVSMYYIGVFQTDKLVGIALIQRVQLYVKDMFRQAEVSCFKTFLKYTISKVLKGNILVVGNLTHTGQHGLYYDAERISSTLFYAEVFKGISELKTIIKRDAHKTIRLILLKDFFSDDALLNNSFFQTEKLHKVTVQPNMVMDIREVWHTTDDYVRSMTKKYRTRFRRAKRKLNSIACKEMNLEAIKTNSQLLHSLYLNVSKNAKFNTFILPNNHFYEYKLHLKDNFKVFGYYLKGELIGFFTLICNRKQLETYFLGYSIEHQYQNQLYLNMLYDMAKFGIAYDFDTIIYARTAMEIKSSVGAKPKPMVMYIKHTNRLLNAILKQIFRFMNPAKDWQERHPFG